MNDTYFNCHVLTYGEDDLHDHVNYIVYADGMDEAIAIVRKRLGSHWPPMQINIQHCCQQTEVLSRNNSGVVVEGIPDEVVAFVTKARDTASA